MREQDYYESESEGKEFDEDFWEEYLQNSKESTKTETIC
jgi:hypothetical protein